MDSFIAASDVARKKTRVADHILTQTYPLVKDPKLLIAVLQNLYDAVGMGIEALLEYEASRDRLPTLPETFDARLVLFRQHLVPRYDMPAEFLRFVGELRETINEHRKSPVEFIRRGEFVICDEGYRIRTLNTEQLKRYLLKTKAFIGFMEEKVNRNDAIIAQRG
ncbi:hypothetical protein GOV07_04745 [Candidatus Woesearchaeota archaeon]|nr:hypothetical protein [Candidatus Woesearchaeota archaeon]